MSKLKVTEQRTAGTARRFRFRDAECRMFIPTGPRRTEAAEPQQQSWFLRLRKLNLANAEFWRKRTSGEKQ